MSDIVIPHKSADLLLPATKTMRYATRDADAEARLHLFALSDLMHDALKRCLTGTPTPVEDAAFLWSEGKQNKSYEIPWRMIDLLEQLLSENPDREELAKYLLVSARPHQLVAVLIAIRLFIEDLVSSDSQYVLDTVECAVKAGQFTAENIDRCLLKDAARVRRITASWGISEIPLKHRSDRVEPLIKPFHGAKIPSAKKRAS